MRDNFFSPHNSSLINFFDPKTWFFPQKNNEWKFKIVIHGNGSTQKCKLHAEDINTIKNTL